MILNFVFSADHQKLIDELIAQKTDPKILEMVKDLVDNQECCGQTQSDKTELTNHNRQDLYASVENLGQKINQKDTKKDIMPKLYIFMSYSVPKALWQELWAQRSIHPFQFIIRGIPHNSFKALSEKVMDYQCAVDIHPDLFQKYNITKVPAFVMVQGEQYRTVYGSVSLEYALKALAYKAF